jgi:hypothetical protein
MLNKSKYSGFFDVDPLMVRMPQITWLDGIPGCGKTIYIINNFTLPTDEYAPD